MQLHEQRCTPRTGAALGEAEARLLLSEVKDWQLAGDAIEKSFVFLNFHRTMAFVNAVAWIAHTQDHHPEMQVGYKRCTLRWSTHSVNGLSINDFICAARVDALGAS